jgi:hypothetical protein
MRGILLKRTFANLLSANLAWPVVVVPWHALAFLRSFGRDTRPAAPGPRNPAP